MLQTNDTERIRRILQGDCEAFSGLIDRYKYAVYGICLSLVGDFDLADIWYERADHVDLTTPVNFVATLDLIGGSSGSAVINADAELVGLIFDGNLQNVENDFLFTTRQARGICVHSEGIMEAVSKGDEAPALAAELRGEG